MASKQTKTRKSKSAAKPAEPRTLWFASLGAFSLVRRHGEELVTRWIAESQTLQTRTRKFALAVIADVRKQLEKTYKPLQARAQEQTEKFEAILERSIDRVRSAFGIPSQAEIDELSRRVAALTRQLKTAK